MSLAGGVLAAVLAPGVANAQTVREGQWYLDYLNIPQAQRISNGSGVTVAVVDSGVDASHPDLAGSVLTGASFGNAQGRPATEDTDGHGTGMAGIIAGRGGDDRHETGVAPGVKILPVRTSTTSDNDPDATAQAIRWAVDHGADVINVSQGGNESTPAEVSAVHYAEVHNVVVVGAAGNTDAGIDSIAAPGRLKGVLNVTGVDRSGTFWSGSAQGKYAALSAPAVKIIGPSPTSVYKSGYSEGTGTSAAAAIVSGVAALVRAKYPSMDAANVINRIVRTATDRGPKGWDQQYGFGIVNPVGALTADVPTVDKNPLGGVVPDPLASSGAPQHDATPAQHAAAGTSSGLSLPLILAVAAVVVVLVIAAMILLVLRNNRRAAVGVAADGPAPPRAEKRRSY
ncbi:type VII secretion-associated serine protease mycosin [Actinocatenispora rupis]|uniref:Type VII secretion-associated serine protease n=1 Tax=Actinocatenispora rupis TaxID=519421 RepID=A0A8J3N9T5_9ACTN|nr:type VII secretion-associated serine protease [Actinocatenispora rupis]